MKYSFTSESVTEGHPDKLADQISDAILDGVLKEDKDGRVACETLLTRGLAFVAGEITTKAYVDIPAIIRKTVEEAGYIDPSYGFDNETVAVVTGIQEQSPDISMGVDTGGAGDQGMMIGYATNETEEYMPLPIVLAHRLTYELSRLRKERVLPYLRPDGKAQVTVEYEDGKPLHVTGIVIAAQHDPQISLNQIRDDIYNLLIKKRIPENMITTDTRVVINGTGKFTIGGPQADTGLTGRKLMVDTYGGIVPHGGGCFSGKDPTKVDRSATYFARYVAKNMVAAGVADRLELHVSYAIGEARPMAITVKTFGTGRFNDEKIVKAIKQLFDFSPSSIIEYLNLRRPIYKRTAAYGHFGRSEEGFTWERLDRVQEIEKFMEKI